MGGLLFLIASVMAAQDYRAKAQGLVTDVSNAVVAGASVTLHNRHTGVEHTRVTDGNGRYFFDFVEPGNYRVTVELAGFSKFVQEDVLVQVRSDVTVNAALKLGAVVETVTVTESVAQVQFNTTSLETTVDRKMLSDMPIIARNPFSLALLDPAVVNRYTNATFSNPFFMWPASSIDVGGSTSRKNDLPLDGAPLMLGQKSSYAPPMDAVQEFTVQQNSVDAEFGHSAGGIMSLSMKAGANEFHGAAYYFGRNPALNAVSNAISRTPNMTRNHIWGGTLGNPLRQNKLFTFTSWEQWRTRDPYTATMTLPTDLERVGDFSQSLNQYGGRRAIHDPWTTISTPSTNTSVRTPFPNNVIPPSRQDPTAVRMMKDIWKPNRPPDNITGVNNFRKGYAWTLTYWNFSNRTDWNISERWKVFGRYSVFHTTVDLDNHGNSPATALSNGGPMNCRNYALDSVYSLSPTAVLNLSWSYAAFEDDYAVPKPKIAEKGLQEFWPGNPWYQPCIGAMPAVYWPSISVASSFGRSSYWIQHVRNQSAHASLRKSAGRSQWKTGAEARFNRSYGHFPNLMSFSFGTGLTANTFISPDTRVSGISYATFLLGAIGSDSSASRISDQGLSLDFLAFYLQNDYKLSRRVTLNLGLRYEHESAPVEDQNRFTRYIDLTEPIPEMQASPPKIPADAARLFGKSYVFNGAYVFSEDSHRGWFDVSRLILIPRAGLAIRLTDKTAVRLGYARYVTPPSTALNTLERQNLPGFSATTTAAPVLEGKPQAVLSNPFPPSNPLILPEGKRHGRYTNLGAGTSWHIQGFELPVNDRFNFTFQRQLPDRTTIEATYFFNFGHHVPYTKNLNLSDPRLSYTHQAALAVTIPNPFFQYLTPDKFPGQLRNQARASVGSLLKPYPHYTGLSQLNTPELRSRYRALQLKLQRQSAGGYHFLVAYNYNRQRGMHFFNAIEEYAGDLSWLGSAERRRRLNVAGGYDFPIGRKRRFFSELHPVLNGIAGGWSASWIFALESGALLRFGQAIVSGDPRIENPTRDRWFATSLFQKPLPYTPRMNPYQYEGLTGPQSRNFDATLSKFFPLTEKKQLEFKVEAYNVTNSFIPSAPSTDVMSSLFGRSTGQSSRGRELQYCIRLLF